jgi:hypothetical protein
MRRNNIALMLVGVLIALFIPIQVVVAARAQANSDTSLRTAKVGEVRQQHEPPVLDPVERIQLAFPGFRSGGERTGLFPGRLMSQDFDDWPPMLHIGDSAEIAGKTFTVKEVLLVPGSDRSMTYEPATGRKRYAPEGLRTNLFDFSKNTEVFIPPNSTLVMVRVEVEPEAVERPQGQAGCETQGERDYADVLRISNNSLGETKILLTDRDENFGGYRSPRIYCLTCGWLYFHIGSLTANESQLWFEIVDTNFEDDLAIWELTTPPES